MHGRDVLRKLRSVTVERVEVRPAANHVMTVLRDGDGKTVKVFGMRGDSVVGAIAGPRGVRRLSRAAEAQVSRILGARQAAAEADPAWRRLVQERRDRTIRGTFTKRAKALATAAAEQGVGREELLARVGREWDEAVVRHVMET